MIGITVSLLLGAFASAPLGTRCGSSAAPPENAAVAVRMKGRDILIDPRSGEQRELAPAVDHGVVSPDGKRIVYMAVTPGAQTVDMFIADHAPGHDAHAGPVKSNIHPLLTNTLGMQDVAWTPDGKDILFRSGNDAGAQVYLIAASPLPDCPRRISDDTGECSRVRVAPDGRIAWSVLRKRQEKEALYDLLISDGKTLAPRPEEMPPSPKQPKDAKQQAGAHGAVPPPPNVMTPRQELPADHTPLKTTALLRNVALWSFNFSPDGTKLAYCADTSLFIHDFADGSTREIKFSEVNDKLTSHAMHDVAWSPDGKVIAGFVTFLGGRSVEQGKDPFFIFGDKELFFFPLEGKPWWVARPPEAHEYRWTTVDAAAR